MNIYHLLYTLYSCILDILKIDLTISKKPKKNSESYYDFLKLKNHDSFLQDRLQFIWNYDRRITYFYDYCKYKLEKYKNRGRYRSGKISFNNYLFLGYIYAWKHIKFWLPSVVCALLIVYYSMVTRLLPFLKITTTWFIVFMLFYWLISGFVFFTKRYKYGKFTSAIQRFWRRSLILFWLVESSLFIVFIYLMFNASQEPVFMYDFIQLQKNRFYSWRFFLYKSFLVYLVIMLTYILLLSIKWNIFSKFNYLVIIITFLLTYILWIEFYQFFYVLNWYGEICWIFDLEDRVWYAESMFRRARIVNHYATICIIAKFWHIIFIYIFWIFFLLRYIENNTFSYIAVSANLQNFIILYIMNWLLMYPYFKKVFRKFLGKNYTSLNEYRKQYVHGFIYDLKLFIFEGDYLNISLYNFFKLKFPYAFEFRNWSNYGVYNKHYITSFINNFFVYYI